MEQLWSALPVEFTALFYCRIGQKKRQTLPSAQQTDLLPAVDTGLTFQKASWDVVQVIFFLFSSNF